MSKKPNNKLHCYDQNNWNSSHKAVWDVKALKDVERQGIHRSGVNWTLSTHAKYFHMEPVCQFSEHVFFL